jgi:hypothetical protein
MNCSEMRVAETTPYSHLYSQPLSSQTVGRRLKPSAASTSQRKQGQRLEREQLHLGGELGMRMLWSGNCKTHSMSCSSIGSTCV